MALKTTLYFCCDQNFSTLRVRKRRGPGSSHRAKQVASDDVTIDYVSTPCLLSLPFLEQFDRFNSLCVAIFCGVDEVSLKRYHAVPQDHALFKSEIILITDGYD